MNAFSPHGQVELWISAAGPPWAFLRAGVTVVSMLPHVQESLSVSPGPAIVLRILPYVSRLLVFLLENGAIQSGHHS